jgi:hypothetical protein
LIVCIAQLKRYTADKVQYNPGRQDRSQGGRGSIKRQENTLSLVSKRKSACGAPQGQNADALLAGYITSTITVSDQVAFVGFRPPDSGHHYQLLAFSAVDITLYCNIDGTDSRQFGSNFTSKFSIISDCNFVVLSCISPRAAYSYSS